MNLETSYSLLKPNLLNDSVTTDIIDYWLSLLNRPNGWHYKLDIIWILNELNKSGIHPGSTILDAGAGQGVLQYLLAAKGYKVISFDYAKRKILKRTKKIFDIENNSCDLNYYHKYMSHISFEKKNKSLIHYLKNIKDYSLLSLIRKVIRWVKGFKLYVKEISNRKKNMYGKIYMKRGYFQQLGGLNLDVDAVVSLSAIEHCDKDQIKESLESFLSPFNRKGILLITTSATNEDEDQFEDYFQGWSFSKEGLKKYFNLNVPNWVIKVSYLQIHKTEEFWKQLDPFYFVKNNSYFKDNSRKYPPYLPNGIKYKLNN